ncbi:MAG: FAD-dependent monooxygenase [Pseudomonadota bacterium]
MTIAVVGGGIAGLTTALSLQSHGFAVTLIEQAAGFGEVGAGLQLGPNAVKVLNKLGLKTPLYTAADPPEALQLRSGYSGQTMLSLPLGRAAEQRWGAPYLHIHRADLIDVLGRAAQARGIEIRLSQQVAEFTEEGDYAAVRLAGGEKLRAQCVIAADGVRSMLRDTYFEDEKPEFTGSIAWRCTVPTQSLGRFKPNKAATIWTGRGRHAVTYMLRDGGLTNLVAVVDDQSPQAHSWRQSGPAAQALKDFQGFDPTILKILRKADTLYRWGLYERPLPKRWYKDRLVLVGDACHAMLPFLAQGAAMAIEDAWVLARIMKQNGPTAAAFSAYQSAREGRVKKVIAQSKANGARFHLSKDSARLGAFAVLRASELLSDETRLAQFDWVYGFDATTS